MQPADDIRRLIDESQITSSAQVDRRILADALADLENRRIAMRRPARRVENRYAQQRQSNSPPRRRSSIAVLLGLQFVGTSSVTFAQAIQPILNANTAILDIIIGVEDPNTPVIHDMIMGSRIRRTVGGIEEQRQHHRPSDQPHPEPDRVQEGGGVYRSQGPASDPELPG